MVDSPQARPGSPNGERGVPGGTETILVCEDDESVLHLVEQILAGAGYEVLSAQNGGRALTAAVEHSKPIHLLLADVIMPDMNGKKLADSLSEWIPNLKTIFMSGYTANVVAHRGVEEQAVSFLEKPFTPASLLRRVREVLDQ